MIIEIKDIPQGQKISKIDIHIDFINGEGNSISIPVCEKPKKELDIQIPQNKNAPYIPDEMLNGDF